LECYHDLEIISNLNGQTRDDEDIGLEVDDEERHEAGAVEFPDIGTRLKI